MIKHLVVFKADVYYAKWCMARAIASTILLIFYCKFRENVTILRYLFFSEICGIINSKRS